MKANVTVYEVKRMETLLQSAGAIAEQTRISGRSLSCADRQFIECARSFARDLGLSEPMRTTIEGEGAAVIRAHARFDGGSLTA